MTSVPPTASRPSAWRAPSGGSRVLLGAVGGFVAGIVFIALNSWYVSAAGRPELAPFRTVATLVQGPPPAEATIWIGMAVHSALSVVLGVVLAVLTQPLRGRAGLVAAAALLYGVVVYVVDLQLLSRYVHQFSAVLPATNQPLELAAHLVFGAVLLPFVLSTGPAVPTEARQVV